jgi:hypothetical protein
MPIPSRCCTRALPRDHTWPRAILAVGGIAAAHAALRDQPTCAVPQSVVAARSLERGIGWTRSRRVPPAPQVEDTEMDTHRTPDPHTSPPRRCHRPAGGSRVRARETVTAQQTTQQTTECIQ